MKAQGVLVSVHMTAMHEWPMSILPAGATCLALSCCPFTVAMRCNIKMVCYAHVGPRPRSTLKDRQLSEDWQGLRDTHKQEGTSGEGHVTLHQVLPL